MIDNALKKISAAGVNHTRSPTNSNTKNIILVSQEEKDTMVPGRNVSQIKKVHAIELLLA